MYGWIFDIKSAFLVSTEVGDGEKGIRLQHTGVKAMKEPWEESRQCYVSGILACLYFDIPHELLLTYSLKGLRLEVTPKLLV